MALVVYPNWDNRPVHVRILDGAGEGEYDGRAMAMCIRAGARGRAWILSALLALPVTAHAPTSTAQEVSAADKREAAKKFAEGRRAFWQKDYQRAAEAFEEANRIAPHHSALWNAARAWHRAGNLPRAANLYDEYLDAAPPNAPDRNNATSAMTELAAQLGKLEVHAATGFENVLLDGEPVGDDPVFVTPGEHLIEGTYESEVVRKKQTIGAGETMSVTLEPPPPPPPPAPPPKPKPKPEPKPEKWSPTVVYVGGAVTLAAAAYTSWSGFDTWEQKDAFDQASTQDNLDEGKSRQNRTNIALGVTVASAAFTTIAAVWLVDWDKDQKPGGASMELGAGPQSVLLRGRF